MLAVSQIQDWIADQLHESSTDTQLTTDLMLRWTNEGMNEVARAAQWRWLEAQELFTFGGDGAGVATNAGVTYLPHRIGRLLSLWPSGRNSREPILIVGAWELDAMSPTPIIGGDATYLAVWGYYNVARDNPTTGVLVAADTGASAATIRITGVDNNGEDLTEDVAANGGTSVGQFAAGPDGVRSIHVLNSTVAAGTGIITVTSGGVQIERLNVAAGERSRERLRTELTPAPTAPNNTYVVRYYKRIRQVEDADSMLDIPFEFESLLFHAIGRRLALYRGDTDQVGYFEQMFSKTVRELKAWQNRQPGRMRGLKQLSRSGLRLQQGW
jgi:hypothetical protein